MHFLGGVILRLGENDDQGFCTTLHSLDSFWDHGHLTNVDSGMDNPSRGLLTAARVGVKTSLAVYLAK